MSLARYVVNDVLLERFPFSPPSCLPAQVYQRMRDYYGPQYDIQTGVHHQGYGDEEAYDGFWGKGSLFIDLPRSRVYDASFNCTPGYQVSSAEGR